jgi:pyruvate/2-oxoglutarate dehydrogenase complex dihydrolipoamide dehydrogenase (E3) component
VQPVRGEPTLLEGAVIVIAVGSVPRTPPNVPVDHEAILDSDSILSLLYLPRSLTVLGSGVVACEYASIFAGLGVEVTVIDRFPQPLGFLDPELTTRYVKELERMGGAFLGEAKIAAVTTDGISVTTRLEDGRTVTTDKMLCAQGRVEAEARKRHGNAVVGRARFDEIARGHVANCREGFLKMVADPHGDRLLGVQIIGEGATELIHLAQMALVTGASIDVFVDNVFNFPTLAEAYRVAALDVVGKRAQRDEHPAAAAAG